MMNLLKYLDARMGEPSTYASLATMLVALHVNVSSSAMQTITMWGIVVSGTIGVLLSEVGGKPSMQIAQDVLADLVARVKALPDQAGKTAAAIFLPVFLASALLLSACSSTSTNGTVTAQQAVTVAQNAVATLTEELAAVKPLLSAAQQGQVTGLTQDVADAQNILAALTTSMSASQTATALQQAEQDLNAVVAAVAAVPMPPPYSTAVAALAISLPIIETFVNSVQPTAAASLMDAASRKAVIAAANQAEAQSMAASWK